MNVTDFLVFGRVAKTQSFSEAAEQLGMTRSAVSKSVTRLEHQLGVNLLNRSPRRVSVTEPGRKLLRHSMRIEEAVELAIDSVHGADQQPRGHVSCSLPTSMGASLMPAIIRDFRPAWPEISLNVHFDERIVDLVGGGYDVAIRVASKLEDSNLLCRRLGSTRQVLVASQKYLDNYGTPKTVSELSKHRCLGVRTTSQQRAVWRFTEPEGVIEVPVDRVLTANTDVPLILAACLGDGIIYIPKVMVGCELAQGRLVEVLPEYADQRSYGIYAVYPNQKPPAKTRVFVDFLERELPKLESVDRWALLGYTKQGAQKPGAGFLLDSRKRAFRSV